MGLNESHKIKNSFFTTTIILFSLLQSYAFFIKGIGVGEAILVGYFLSSLIYMYRYDCIRLIKHPLFVFLIWVFISGLISSVFQKTFNYSGWISLLLRQIYYITIIAIAIPRYFNYALSLKIYKYSTWVYTIYLFLQIFSYKIFNIVIPWYIKFLPLNISNDYYAIDFESKFNDFFRPYSLFTEPGMYAQVMIPYLIILLFRKNVPWLEISFLGLGLLFSTSGQGIIYFLSLLLIKLIVTIIQEKKWERLLIIPFFFLSALYINNIEMINRSMQRLFGENSSSDSRIFNGFNIFIDLPSFYKVFGIGYNNLSNFVSNNYFIKVDSLYVSSFTNILICTGIVGSIIILYFFLTQVTLKSLVSKILIVQLFVSMFVSNVFLSSAMIIYFALIYGEEKKYEY